MPCHLPCHNPSLFVPPNPYLSGIMHQRDWDDTSIVRAVTAAHTHVGGKKHMSPKPLSDAVKQGFVHLAGQQHSSGGWSQGGGWRSDQHGGRIEGADIDDPADVANTCAATLAF